MDSYKITKWTKEELTTEYTTKEGDMYEKTVYSDGTYIVHNNPRWTWGRSQWKIENNELKFLHPQMYVWESWGRHEYCRETELIKTWLFEFSIFND